MSTFHSQELGMSWPEGNAALYRHHPPCPPDDTINKVVPPLLLAMLGPAAVFGDADPLRGQAET